MRNLLDMPASELRAALASAEEPETDPVAWMVDWDPPHGREFFNTKPVTLGNFPESALVPLYTRPAPAVSEERTWKNPLYVALRNCLTLAAKRRKGPDAEWWLHVVRFCREADVVPRVTRGADIPPEDWDGDIADVEVLDALAEEEK